MNKRLFYTSSSIAGGYNHGTVLPVLRIHP
jgi:hypothetical protein